jgi:hypothetical protein
MADPIKTAKSMFDNFLSKADPLAMPGYSPDAKDPQARAAGLKGARAGGIARAASLTPKRRNQIARKAANSRWKTNQPH